jgi:hypothetical protein
MITVDNMRCTGYLPIYTERESSTITTEELCLLHSLSTVEREQSREQRERIA